VAQLPFTTTEQTNICAKFLPSKCFRLLGFPSLQESKEKTAKMDCAGVKLDRKTLEGNKIGHNVAVMNGKGKLCI